jgi:pilus assembly protein CpaB
MNRRFAFILLSAFVVAAVGSYIVYRMVGNQLGARGRAQTVRVVMAARNLEVGTLIRDSDLKMGEMVGTAPKGASQKLEALVGRGVISNLYEGEPVLESRLAPSGSGGGLAATIRPGMRACAVRVNEVVGVAGFVVPGMRVDVLISGTTPGARSAEGPKVKTLLQNIEVLSAGTNFQKDAEGKPVQVPVVNLLVTPEQAEVLSLAGNETRIQLVLRNPLDTQLAKTPGAAMAGLFADSQSPAPAPVKAPRPAMAPKKPAPPAKFEIVKQEQPFQPQPSGYSVQVWNGAKKTEEKFNSTGDQK